MATAKQIADQAQQHPTAIRALENWATQHATQQLAERLAAAHRDANTHWTRTTQGQRPTAQALEKLLATIKRLLAAAFRGQGARAQKAAAAAAHKGALLGAAQAAAIAEAMTGQPTPDARPQPAGSRGITGPASQAAVASIPGVVEEEHQRALALLTTATATALGGAVVATVFNRTRRAVARVALAVSVGVTSAVAAGVTAVARALGPRTRLLWVAEPGACPACVAYAGQSIPIGGRFPGGLTVDARRTVFPDPIPGPPRHPHCRCDLIPWRREWHTGGTPLPELLRTRARTGGA
ncbi:hypothetical protein OG337_29030 [[Kitasatospora] papulosa]|uniref:hypothetical protein n=1 Tax=Streptomyces TaxID=1883 RepID=UPI0029A7EBE4|nr:MULTISPECIES: hypothetical protein [unclassified Streptomyces]MDX3183497.1 hypothetical protein [Streptomyces sp. ME02-7008A-1]MDX3303949.1 hypothetical protein [Streptomyces sp. ME02-7008A]WSZ51156.1 hypothetical protein OG337_29030 [[Kitasatospora] papulosa]